MREILELVKNHASSQLWRVHFHRSTFWKPKTGEIVQAADSHGSTIKLLREFFDLIKQKPLVDIKLDGLNGLPSSSGTSKHMFAELCTTNTEVREKVKIEKVAQLMLLHKVLKQRQ